MAKVLVPSGLPSIRISMELCKKKVILRERTRSAVQCEGKPLLDEAKLEVQLQLFKNFDTEDIANCQLKEPSCHCFVIIIVKSKLRAGGTVAVVLEDGYNNRSFTVASVTSCCGTQV